MVVVHLFPYVIKGILLCTIMKIKNQIKILFLKNVRKLYNTFKQQFEVWHKLKLSWFGRVLVIKMNIPPKFNFVFLHMALHISKKLLNSVQTIINRFIWSKNPSRIRARMIQQSVHDGEAGVRNIKEFEIL